MIILGIDPGPETSGIVWYDAACKAVLKACGDAYNEDVITEVLIAAKESTILQPKGKKIVVDRIVCEDIQAMYAHVGAATVKTIKFIGRIEQASRSSCGCQFLTSKEIKKIVCGTSAAKDPAVRQALIDKIGAPGKKNNPGPTYGVTKHAWRALAAAYAQSLS